MNTLKLLKSLSEAFGPSGFEDEVRQTIRTWIEPLVDELQVDALGNLLATRKGESKRCVMLDAHVDEVGFRVRHVDDQGFIRLAALGGWDDRTLLTHRVTFSTRAGERLAGVFGAKPPHILEEAERSKALKLEDLFVDLGAASREEVAARGLTIGDPETLWYPFEELSPGVALGKAFDDRAGCAVRIVVLDALKGRSLPFTLVCSFSVCEEVGLRGAKTATFGVKPDLALALEGTIGGDMPGVSEDKCPTALGKGPALSVADRTIIVNRKLVQALEDLAKGKGISFQYKLPTYGGTDAGAIHTSRRGVLTGVVSVSCRCPVATSTHPTASCGWTTSGTPSGWCGSSCSRPRRCASVLARSFSGSGTRSAPRARLVNASPGRASRGAP
ncbi:MAG: M42 family metallopeptidase [Armatimonadetes bacterium]|nr:M42 family metallopeptidase [Armatimonadota bacterium]